MLVDVGTWTIVGCIQMHMYNRANLLPDFASSSYQVIINIATCYWYTSAGEKAT